MGGREGEGRGKGGGEKEREGRGKGRKGKEREGKRERRGGEGPPTAFWTNRTLELHMCAGLWPHDNTATRSAGAEVAGSANSAAQYT